MTYTCSVLNFGMHTSSGSEFQAIRPTAKTPDDRTCCGTVDGGCQNEAADDWQCPRAYSSTEGTGEPCPRDTGGLSPQYTYRLTRKSSFYALDDSAYTATIMIRQGYTTFIARLHRACTLTRLSYHARRLY